MNPRTLLAAVSTAAIATLIVSGGAFTATPPNVDVGRTQLPKDTKDAKLDSRLVAVANADERSGPGAAIAAARKSGLKVKGGRVRAVVLASNSAAADAAVKGHGGDIEAKHGKLTQALLPPGQLKKISREDSVQYVRPPLEPVPEGVAGEGVGATNANIWHAAGRTGAGTEVAVIDLGFGGYVQSQANGDLPASLTTVDFCSGNFSSGEVHGTAVAEIVHELAPDAALTLICIDSEVTLAQAEDYVEAHNIRIVNHSVGWFNAVRGDGKGGSGTIDQVVADARANGILWVNAAGNDATRHWSGAYNDSDGDDFENFSSSYDVNFFHVPSGGDACIYLKWDSWPTSTQDFDLYLQHYNPSGPDELLAYSENQQSGSQSPTEAACFTSSFPTDDFFYFYIYRFGASAKPRFDAELLGGFGLQFQTAAGSINELAASPNTLAAGAICWQNNAFDNSALEPFSSRGPTIDNRVKPDISGPDAVSGGTYGQFVDCNGGPDDGFPHGFFGTSAAAPHTAGVAALILGQNPSYTVTQLQSAITGAAKDLGAAGKDNLFGAGRLRVPSIVAPTVSSFAPTAAAVGTVVTVSGTNLTAISSASIGGTPVTTITPVSSTQVKLTVPAGAHSGQIAVTTPDGTGTSTANFKVLPKITGFNPLSAPRGDVIDITGATFTTPLTVKFGTVAATTVTVDRTSRRSTPRFRIPRPRTRSPSRPPPARRRAPRP